MLTRKTHRNLISETKKEYCLICYYDFMFKFYNTYCQNVNKFQTTIITLMTFVIMYIRELIFTAVFDFPTRKILCFRNIIKAACTKFLMI